ncbi:type II secretion system protein GspJ [Bdellovibrio sp. HCB2-146]|uniref:type II secretion system protein GspJ n=1 Tax=Bdellovibrio sp. HCB2-146 TaxID=3394362 RepID=UPI0039BD6F59
MRNKRGFTLIEVMITITILGTLTVLVAQTIQQAIKSKVKVQGQVDDASRMRDAVRLIERDINLAYHYRDIEKELEQILKKKNNPNQGQNPNPNPGGFVPPTDPDAIGSQTNTGERREVPRRDPETHFVGSNEKLNFVTMNNARTVRDTRQADFVEVGYELKDCKSLKENGGNSKCIWRRTSPYVDLDVEKGGTEIVLLENVTEFKFRYIGKGKQDWNENWRSDSQGDGVTKGKFPTAVELSLTMTKKEGTREKKYSVQVIAPIHFPNNPEDKPNAQPNQQNNQPAGT